MAPSDVGKVVGTWSAQCIALLPSVKTLTNGLVDGDGRAMSSYDNNTWGINLATCYKYCSWSKIPLSNVFYFESFANAFTNYLLPWLALTAQLPYETGDPWSNIMSFCLAVGSPALVTYSLTLTILNRYWVRRRYSNISAKAEGPSVRNKYGEYIRRVKAIEYLLSEAQQVPLRASQENGWLSSLIVDPGNQDWWGRLRNSLRNTRRGVTFSLVAQVLSAIIAWLFIIISAFQASLGNSTVALQISAGSVWVWLIPVICGWIVVGTQYTNGTIRTSLRADEAQYASLPPIGGNIRTVLGMQRAIRVSSGLTRRLRKNQSVHGGFEISPNASSAVPSSWGGDVCGDERREGPIYNYARVFTWYQFARTLTGAVEATVNNIDSGRAVHLQIQQQQGQPAFEVWAPQNGLDGNLGGDAIEIANYCNLSNHPNHHISAYPSFGKMWQDQDARVFTRIMAASITAMTVQWGTIGSAVIIAYFTPSEGLGCRSTGYMVYGGVGTLVWMFLVASMMLSHIAMIKYQEVHVNNPSMNFLSRQPQNPNQPPPPGGQYYRTWSHGALCSAAVLMRYVGKILAVLNALWIIVSSIFEFVGFYSNCWCSANVISMGGNGWVMLFKTAVDLKTAAQGPWAGGVTMSIFISLISFIIFYLGSKKEDDDA